MINVTKSFLPPIEEYQRILQKAWSKEWITNRGVLVQELEDKLKSYLKSCDLILMNNGTSPIQIGLKLLGGGEIITTPFSYVATTAAIVWENCTPRFVDIHPEYLTIDETKIEEAITPQTTAILATHVFGNPCNTKEIEKIANKHGLKVIYDAAHSFGTKYLGECTFNYGDISTCSFHATKIFHTGEGGALFCNDTELFDKCFYSHNFGHNGPTDFHGLGINAKMSELQAAMGLSVLPYIERIITARKEIVDTYNDNLNFENISSIRIREHTEWNYSYYPIIMSSEDCLLFTIAKLKEAGVFPRRYFYPSLDNLPYVISETQMVNSRSIASRIICLPLYVGLNRLKVEEICTIINDSIKIWVNGK